MSKKKRPRKFCLMWIRPVGEYKDGERRMEKADRFSPVKYKSYKMAMKARCRAWRHPFYAVIFREGNRPKKITQIQIFEDNYSTE